MIEEELIANRSASSSGRTKVTGGSEFDAIWTENLVRRFGDVQAVDGVNIQIPKGEIYGFLGPNGAGKSTMVHMLCTLLARQVGGPLWPDLMCNPIPERFDFELAWRSKKPPSTKTDGCGTSVAAGPSLWSQTARDTTTGERARRVNRSGRFPGPNDWNLFRRHEAPPRSRGGPHPQS